MWYIERGDNKKGGNTDGNEPEVIGQLFACSTGNLENQGKSKPPEEAQH